VFVGCQPSLIVWNRGSDGIDLFKALADKEEISYKVANSLEEIGQQADIILASLGSDHASLDVFQTLFTAQEKKLDRGKSTIFVDMSTVCPSRFSRSLANHFPIPSDRPRYCRQARTYLLRQTQPPLPLRTGLWSSPSCARRSADHGHGRPVPRQEARLARAVSRRGEKGDGPRIGCGESGKVQVDGERDGARDYRVVGGDDDVGGSEWSRSGEGGLNLI
jgi:hypothetical protein